MGDNNDAMEGVESTITEPSNPLILSEDEKRVLDIYDRLEELQLEIALLRAQGVISQESIQGPSEEDITTARQELLEAKATYQLRNSIIENVLTANPIVKAVHSGNNASVVEQDLLPFIEERDDLSITLTQISKKVSTMREELVQVQTDSITAGAKNAEMAATMIALAKDASMQRKDDIRDSSSRRQLDDLEEQLKVSKRKWRIMKGTASATIVGSGVDWARDPKLLEIVLDDEGD